MFDCTLDFALGLGVVKLIEGEVTERREEDEVDFDTEPGRLVGPARRGGVIETTRERGEVDDAESTRGALT